MTDFNTLTFEIKDGVGVATFSRPDKMNTFNHSMMHDLLRLFDLTDADDSVKAVVITGLGRAFCAGADLGGGGDTFSKKATDAENEIIVNGIRRDGGGRVSLRIFRSLKPVIAAVNGAAVGVGATMQLPMDFRIASTAARFGFVFARRGITPEACSSWFLPRLVGVPTALDWVYSGRVFDASEAKEKGLVQSLHAPEDLLPAAIDLAHKVTDASAPVSVAVSRRMIWSMMGASHPMDAHRLDSRSLQSRGKSEDVKEGIGAFLEKREAHYPNRVSSDLPDIFAAEPEFK
jgi:enoyl-CoA hydratase/carnithine racemase